MSIMPTKHETNSMQLGIRFAIAVIVIAVVVGALSVVAKPKIIELATNTLDNLDKALAPYNYTLTYNNNIVYSFTEGLHVSDIRVKNTTDNYTVFKGNLDLYVPVSQLAKVALGMQNNAYEGVMSQVVIQQNNSIGLVTNRLVTKLFYQDGLNRIVGITTGRAYNGSAVFGLLNYTVDFTFKGIDRDLVSYLSTLNQTIKNQSFLKTISMTNLEIDANETLMPMKAIFDEAANVLLSQYKSGDGDELLNMSDVVSKASMIINNAIYASINQDKAGGSSIVNDIVTSAVENNSEYTDVNVTSRFLVSVKDSKNKTTNDTDSLIRVSINFGLQNKILGNSLFNATFNLTQTLNNTSEPIFSFNNLFYTPTKEEILANPRTPINVHDLGLEELMLNVSTTKYINTTINSIISSINFINAKENKNYDPAKDDIIWDNEVAEFEKVTMSTFEEEKSIPDDQKTPSDLILAQLEAPIMSLLDFIKNPQNRTLDVKIKNYEVDAPEKSLTQLNKTLSIVVGNITMIENGTVVSSNGSNNSSDNSTSNK